MKNKFEGINIPIIEIGDKKLILSLKVLEILDAKPGERLSINYIQKNKYDVKEKIKSFIDKM